MERHEVSWRTKMLPHPPHWSSQAPAQLTACGAGLSAHLVPPTDKMQPLSVLLACVCPCVSVSVCVCVCVPSHISFVNFFIWLHKSSEMNHDSPITVKWSNESPERPPPGSRVASEGRTRQWCLFERPSWTPRGEGHGESLAR